MLAIVSGILGAVVAIRGLGELCCSCICGDGSWLTDLYYPQATQKPRIGSLVDMENIPVELHAHEIAHELRSERRYNALVELLTAARVSHKYECDEKGIRGGLKI